MQLSRRGGVLVNMDKDEYQKALQRKNALDQKHFQEKRITNLETRIAELEYKIEELEKCLKQ